MFADVFCTLVLVLSPLSFLVTAAPPAHVVRAGRAFSLQPHEDCFRLFMVSCGASAIGLPVTLLTGEMVVSLALAVVSLLSALGAYWYSPNVTYLPQAHAGARALHDEALKTKNERTDAHRRFLLHHNAEQYFHSRDDAHARMNAFEQNAALLAFLEGSEEYDLSEIRALHHEPWVLYNMAREEMEQRTLPPPRNSEPEADDHPKSVADLLEEVALTYLAVVGKKNELIQRREVLSDPDDQREYARVLSAMVRRISNSNGWF